MKKDICAAVIGSGMIGLSMAVLLTGNGISTKLFVRSRSEEKTKKYDQLMKELEASGVLNETERNKCSSYLKVVTSYKELQDAEVVFECASEDLEVKQNIYKKLFENCSSLKAIASTTSAIPSQYLAENSCLSDKILVAHPFYPPHLIPCVEVVPNSCTSEAALNFLMDFLRYLGKSPVILKKDAPGFIANRLQYAMLREAVHIVEAGIAMPEDVDRVLMNSFAPRYTSIGIFEHFDNCGLDLASEICSRLYPDLSGEISVQKLLREHCRKKEYGVKVQKGIYDWTKKDMEEFQKRIEEPYLSHISWNIPENNCVWEG